MDHDKMKIARDLYKLFITLGYPLEPEEVCQLSAAIVVIVECPERIMEGMLASVRS